MFFETDYSIETTVLIMVPAGAACAWLQQVSEAQIPLQTASLECGLAANEVALS